MAIALEQEMILVKRAQNDIGAFDELYKIYLPQIFGYCFNRIPNRSIVEEIVSDIFLSVLEKISSFKYQPGATFSSWLHRIAHNKIVDYFRKHKEISIDNINEQRNNDLHSDLERVVSVSEMQKRVALVLSKINPRYQEVISLKFYSELSNSEIGEITQSKDTAVTLHRALAAFKKEFQRIFPDSAIFDFT